MTRIWLENHPMKVGVKQMLKQHFSDSIVDRFSFLFEAEIYDSANIKNQIKDDRLIMEVRYSEGETSEYICDIYSNMTKSQVQYKLLRYITDMYKSGKIGRNWTEKKGRLVISNEVASGKHETKDEFQND